MNQAGKQKIFTCRSKQITLISQPKYQTGGLTGFQNGEQIESAAKGSKTDRIAGQSKRVL
ncbi:MAG: hypothetical protein WBW41_02455 [Verrucomicrobiia bacterium]